jgi:hypothetical protein
MRLIRSLVFWLILPCLLLAQERLTNDSVLKLVKSGLSDELILSMIKSQPSKFSLGADDLVALKKAGVSEKILGAMIQKNASGSAPAATAATTSFDMGAPAAAPAATAPAAVPVAAPDAPVQPPPEPANTGQSLKDIKHIYVDKLPNDLDQYIRAEVSKQKVKFDVVLDEKEADAILTGVGEADKRVATQITGRYLGLNDTATASLSLVSTDRKRILWAGEAGDRSLFLGALTRGGERKVASRIVKQLKEAIQ